MIYIGNMEYKLFKKRKYWLIFGLMFLFIGLIISLIVKGLQDVVFSIIFFFIIGSIIGFVLGKVVDWKRRKGIKLPYWLIGLILFFIITTLSGIITYSCGASSENPMCYVIFGSPLLSSNILEIFSFYEQIRSTDFSFLATTIGAVIINSILGLFVGLVVGFLERDNVLDKSFNS